MVAAVAQKTVWNIRNAQLKPSEFPVAFAASDEPSKNIIPPPNHPPETPNIKLKPIAQKIMDPNEISIRFFIIMLHTFLARVNPDSTSANPACIKKTINAAKHVQRILASSRSVASVSVSSSAMPMLGIMLNARNKVNKASENTRPLESCFLRFMT